MVCFNAMNLVLFILLFLVCFGVVYAFHGLNKKRKDIVEKFVEETIQCTHENMREYTNQYINNSNVLYKDRYEKCTDTTSTVVIPSRLEVDPLEELMEQHSKLSDSNDSLTDERDTLNSNISDSNSILTDLSDRNSNLNDSNNQLSNQQSNLESISNMLNEMDNYQLRINKLNSLETIITGQVCDEMGVNSNCGLIHSEHFTKEELQRVLQVHIDNLSGLSEAYIMAVKLWVAYKKASSGTDQLIDIPNSNLSSALSSYDTTMDTLKEAEQSMYTVKKLYEHYKSNFYYTQSNNSNATITLSNVPDDVEISFGSNYSYTNTDQDNDDYNTLFETCTNSTTQTNSNNYDISGIECSSSNYAAEILETISNCTNRNDCVREQDSNVKSGLESIYRKKFTRDFVLNYTTSETSPTVKTDVDKKIAHKFLEKVFGS